MLQIQKTISRNCASRQGWQAFSLAVESEAVMNDPVAPSAFPWRSAAVWLTVLIAAMMVYNAMQAFTDPAAFAARFGLAGAADADASFVTVYASRALFLALVTAILLLARRFGALGLFALAAVVMPVADAVQVNVAGGPAGIVARHAAIAVYLVVTGILLLRLERNA
jgi:hypothetical protein